MQKKTTKRIKAVMLALTLLAVALLVSASSTPEPIKIYVEGDSGGTVTRIQMRLRELGYLCYRPTGVYRAMTVKAVEAFQTRCGIVGHLLAVDGKMGPESMQKLFSINAPRVRIPDSVHMPRGPYADRLAVTGTIVDWQTIKPLLIKGKAYTVTDCNTGDTFSLIFAGGENHAEMELYSEAHKEAFDKICGGEYNFLKRPIVISIDGRSVAASMQCWPHGTETKANNGMDGHVCVFFEGSVSHVGALPDVEHNANINTAAGK